MSKNGKKPLIQKYDFANPVIPISKTRVPAIDFIHQLFIAYLKDDLPHHLGEGIKIKEGEGQRLARYGEWIKSITDPVVISAVKCGHGGSFLMMTNEVLNYEMLGSLLGSDYKKHDNRNRTKSLNPTKLERAMFLRVHQDLSQRLVTSWQRAYPLRILIDRLETSPSLLMIFDKNCVLNISSCQVNIASDKIGQITVIYPYPLLEGEVMARGLEELGESI